MAAESRQNSTMRRPAGLGQALMLVLVLVGIGAGWSAFWRWGAERLDSESARLGERLAGYGLSLSCDGRRIEGYPFRIGLFCDRVAAIETRRKWRFSAGALRSAAQAYRPGHAVVELDGPAQIEIPRLPQLSALWSLAHASLRFGISGFVRASVEMRLGELRAFGLRPLAAAETLQAHARPGGAPRTLDLAMSATGLRIHLPAEAGPFSLALSAIAHDVPNGRDDTDGPADPIARLRRQGLKAQIGDLRIEGPSGASLVLSGPVEVAGNGLLSARLSLEAENAGQMLDAIAVLVAGRPDISQAIADLSAALAAGGNRVRTSLTVESGAVRLGLVPIGTIPPLY